MKATQRSILSLIRPRGHTNVHISIVLETLPQLLEYLFGNFFRYTGSCEVDAIYVAYRWWRIPCVLLPE